MSAQTPHVKVGDSRTLTLFEDLSRTQIVMYAGASGDYNPLHSDDRYTTEIAGYPSVFAHGMLTMGATGRLLTEWFGVDAVIRYAARFATQVWPGDTLSATATVDAIRDVDSGRQADISLVTVNAKGETVLSASAIVRLS